MLDNSTELYVDIAQSYLVELEQLVTDAPTLLGQADLSATVRTLHTFKGLSLTIGAKAMSEVCRQSEMLSKSGLQSGALIPEDRRLQATQALQMAAQATHAQLSEALRGLAQATSAPTQEAVVHPEDALPELQALRALLSQSDLQALECFNALRTRYSMLDAQLEPLHQSISTFDFAKAVVQCNELMRTLGSLYRT